MAKGWNRPDRSDMYAAAIVREVRQLFTSKRIMLEECKIDFQEKQPIDPATLPPGFPKPMTKESISVADREMRIAENTMKVERRTVKRSEAKRPPI